MSDLHRIRARSDIFDLTSDFAHPCPLSDEPWTIGRLLTWTIEYLGKHGAENPRLDAEVLLAHARGCKRIELYTAFDEPATEEIRTAFRELVRRRAAGTPVAYLVGHREFYSLDFEVNARRADPAARNRARWSSRCSITSKQAAAASDSSRSKSPTSAPAAASSPSARPSTCRMRT